MTKTIEELSLEALNEKLVGKNFAFQKEESFPEWLKREGYTINKIYFNVIEIFNREPQFTIVSYNVFNKEGNQRINAYTKYMHLDEIMGAKQYTLTNPPTQVEEKASKNISNAGAGVGYCAVDDGHGKTIFIPSTDINKKR